MLANGITLAYKTEGDTYLPLAGLKEVPEMGVDPEKIENTCLSDTVKQYEMGIGDAGDMDFVFKYENSKSTSPYRVLRSFADAGTKVSFEETFPDETKFNWDAYVSVKLGCATCGGSATVNGVIDFTVSMALQSDIAVIDPAGV